MRSWVWESPSPGTCVLRTSACLLAAASTSGHRVGVGGSGTEWQVPALGLAHTGRQRVTVAFPLPLISFLHFIVITAVSCRCLNH